MNHNSSTTPRAPATQAMRKLGLEPDTWQIEVLEAGHPRLLLNCCRQAGKSTVVALLAMAEAVFVPGTRVLILSRSQRQSTELFRVLLEFYDRLGAPLEKRRTVNELELRNFSRVVSLPCKEETIRGYAKISLLIIDEAARVPDDLYRAVRPMLAVSGGGLVCLSTPYGKRGFFHDAWAHGGADWARIEVPAEQIARISKDFLRTERRALGESWFRQEYCCSFEALEGLVYPELGECVVERPGQETGPQHEKQQTGPQLPTPLAGKRVGGIDFGFRNPFAAVWGTLDADGVLWLTGEHYKRNKPLSYHAKRLPRDVMWFADPSGANERCELQCAGFKVRAGNNALRPGIGAVSARIENGTLRIVKGRCPNLLAEGRLYRYGDGGESRGETPVNEQNHALDSLRYLVSGIDARHQAGPRPQKETPPKVENEFWKRVDDERYWVSF